MPPATLALHPDSPQARPLFPVSDLYAEQIREALEVFELALQLPIAGLDGHKPNLPGYPLADTISHLRSGMTRYLACFENKFQDMFDWEHDNFHYPSHDEKLALDWAHGLIDHLLDRWQWRHLLAVQEAQIEDTRPDLAFRMYYLDQAFQRTRPTLTSDEHDAIGHIVPTLRALLDRVAPGGPRMVDGHRAMFSAPQVAYFESFREDDDEDDIRSVS